MIDLVTEDLPATALSFSNAVTLSQTNSVTLSTSQNTDRVFYTTAGYHGSVTIQKPITKGSFQLAKFDFTGIVFTNNQIKFTAEDIERTVYNTKKMADEDTALRENELGSYACCLRSQFSDKEELGAKLAYSGQLQEEAAAGGSMGASHVSYESDGVPSDNVTIDSRVVLRRLLTWWKIILLLAANPEWRLPMLLRLMTPLVASLSTIPMWFRMLLACLVPHLVASLTTTAPAWIRMSLVSLGDGLVLHVRLNLNLSAGVNILV